MAKQKRRQPTVTSLLPSRGVDRASTQEEIKTAAGEMGCNPEELTRLIAFVAKIEEAADELHLSPPEVTNGCMTMLSSALKFCPESDRPDALTSIFSLLWDALGLKRDT